MLMLAAVALAGTVRPDASSTSTPVATDSALAGVDWNAAGGETVEFLSRLLQARSINPPGDETLAVNVVAEKLRAEGIESEVIEFAPGRGSLVARLPGNGQDKPLCLLSHVDVVPAEAERWTVDPYSGLVRDGFVWGRGALDMKGMTAVEVMTLVTLKRLAVPLSRDVVLLAVADEEVDGQGIDAVIAQWDQIGCSHVVNEGGLGLSDLIFDGQTFHAISVAEKGAVWLKMIASGSPGHGSTPVPGRAPEHLARALQRLAEREDAVVWSDAHLETFRRAGRAGGGLKGLILSSPALTRLLAKRSLLSMPPMRATLTNTVNVTGFFGGDQPNVVPSEVGAVLDCRILPGFMPEDIVRELIALVDDPAVRFEVISASTGNESPWDDPFFNALAARAVEGQEGAVAGPVRSPGYTDSKALRPLGARAYGYAPFVIDGELLGTMHGDDERVPVAEVHAGLRRLAAAVLDVSLARPDGPMGSPRGEAPR
ncbi:MAG: M20/M25/M40 family metallo-hydrolase [Deltaproteobacteria bacterium]|nr:M20/M25/M40 family metallo-hydrolase [Deltaproteobacteria bacterium]